LRCPRSPRLVPFPPRPPPPPPWALFGRFSVLQDRPTATIVHSRDYHLGVPRTTAARRHATPRPTKGGASSTTTGDRGLSRFSSTERSHTCQVLRPRGVRWTARESVANGVAFRRCQPRRHPSRFISGLNSRLRTPLSNASLRLAETQRMARGHCVSLALQCRTLSFPSPYRFIPALSDNRTSPPLQARRLVDDRTTEACRAFRSTPPALGCGHAGHVYRCGTPVIDLSPEEQAAYLEREVQSAVGMSVEGVHPGYGGRRARRWGRGR